VIGEVIGESARVGEYEVVVYVGADNKDACGRSDNLDLYDAQVECTSSETLVHRERRQVSGGVLHAVLATSLSSTPSLSSESVVYAGPDVDESCLLGL
jgi:hypothetical protein